MEIFFSRSSGGWQSKVQVLVGLFPPEASLLGLQVTTFLLCSHMAFSLCVHISDVPSSSNKNSSPVGLGPAHIASFHLNYFFK